MKVLLGIARADAADDGLADDDERHDGRQRFLQTVAKERREQQTERGERDEHGGDEGGVPLRQQHPNASCDDEDEHGPSREEGVDAGGYHEVLDGSGAPVQKREEADHESEYEQDDDEVQGKRRLDRHAGAVRADARVR